MILQHIRDHGIATPKELANGLGIDHGLAKKTCRRMVHDDQLDTDGRGNYSLPATLSLLSPESPWVIDGDTGDTGDTPDDVEEGGER